jgi:hypothetical protein
MNCTRKQRIARFISVIIGAGSGPFLFKNAGFVDFPRLQVSHLMIVICYVMGAMTIVRFVCLRLLGFSTKTEFGERQP